jgi:hypothetical protein
MMQKSEETKLKGKDCMPASLLLSTQRERNGCMESDMGRQDVHSVCLHKQQQTRPQRLQTETVPDLELHLTHTKKKKTAKHILGIKLALQRGGYTTLIRSAGMNRVPCLRLAYPNKIFDLDLS